MNVNDGKSLVNDGKSLVNNGYLITVINV